MAITSRFLKDIRESAEADLPTHPSDASAEMPDTLAGKVGPRKVKHELDSANAGLVSKSTATTEEVKEEETNESAEADLPTHPSDAATQVPDKLTENDEEDMPSKKKAASDTDEDKKEKVSEDTDKEDKEDSEETIKEADANLSSNDNEDLSKEEDEDAKDTAEALTKDEDLPESFKTKVSSIFEAAVKRTTKRRVSAHNKKLVESYNNKLASNKIHMSETLTNKVDGYLDYVVEEWMKENRVAIEGGLRSEITEKFIVGLKTLFEDNYIEVPAEKVNIISEQDKKIKNLEQELNDELVKCVELRKENISLKKSSIIKKLTEGLTTSDAAKFSELCEGVSFDAAQTFGQKLKVIKETYFPKNQKSSNDIDESLLVVGGLNYDEPVGNTAADVYAQTITRMSKK